MADEQSREELLKLAAMLRLDKALPTPILHFLVSTTQAKLAFIGGAERVERGFVPPNNVAPWKSKLILQLSQALNKRLLTFSDAQSVIQAMKVSKTPMRLVYSEHRGGYIGYQSC